MKKILLLGTLSLLLGACNYGSTPTSSVVPTTPPTETAVATAAPTMEAVPTKKEIVLAEENKSGQKGMAVLEEVNGKVRVTVTMSGTKMGTQPAHIHIGVCPGVGAVKYPLTNIVSGKSTTVLDVTMAELLNQGPLALNLHKSAAEVGVYTACGVL